MPPAVTAREEAVAALAEVFREHGYAGASLSRISRATGLGKGSLYYLFPGGKEDMAAAVLADIGGWFEENVFGPLHGALEPARAITITSRAVQEYFRSGRRVCLFGVLALGNARDRFAGEVRQYFVRWVEALTETLIRLGRTRAQAAVLAEDVVVSIQGAIVLARALDDPASFRRVLARLRRELELPS